MAARLHDLRVMERACSSSPLLVRPSFLVQLALIVFASATLWFIWHPEPPAAPALAWIPALGPCKGPPAPSPSLAQAVNVVDAAALAATPELVARGREAFSHYCMVCHGLDGQNTGVPFAAAMSPPVPSLASAEVQAYTDGQLHWIVRNGLWPSGMPAARDLLHDEEIWRIVLYLRHLPLAGSLGEPDVYARP